MCRSWFVKITSSNLHSQTTRARKLKERRFTSHHLSCVRCHMSPFTCHMSHGTCNFFFSFLFTLNSLLRCTTVYNNAIHCKTQNFVYFIALNCNTALHCTIKTVLLCTAVMIAPTISLAVIINCLEKQVKWTVTHCNTLHCTVLHYTEL